MTLGKTVKLKKVHIKETDMRIGRWFKKHYPNLGFCALQKLLRSGQVRLDGRRVHSDTDIHSGQIIRIPPSPLFREEEKQNIPLTLTEHAICNRDSLSKMLLYKDSKVFVFNKPPGLAVQGGSGILCHVDGMLEAWRNKKGEKPHLVHRIDRDTSGILVVARTHSAAQALTASFRVRDVKKRYWALVHGIPRKKEGRISNWLFKETGAQGDRMRVCVRVHEKPEADHSVSYYYTIDTANNAFSWLEMEPYTGRTHQLRIHASHIGHPIIGDSKYCRASEKKRALPKGIQNRLHLHAYRICAPNPSGGILDITAPLPPHMVQSFKIFAFKSTDNIHLT